MEKIILVKKWFNTLKGRYQYDNLFKVVENGFEELNSEDLLEERTLRAEEVAGLVGMLDGEEEVEDMKELLEKAFEVDPEAGANILGIKVYDTLPWEEYHPDVA